MKKVLLYGVLILLGLSFCAPENESDQAQLTSPTPTFSVKSEPIPTASLIESPSPVFSTSPSAIPTPESDALKQLTGLLIKGRAPKTGYDRDLYGSAWSDVDRNGCDTRNDILTRDLINIVYRSGTGNCVVESGLFYDPYTNTEFEFIKSSSGSTIEIDHVVSLSDSWQKGAQQWNSDLRKQFANDPLNLVATSKSTNRSKSDSDAASWLPPNKEIRCAFVARQVAVKSAYQLWVTQAEFDAMAKVLSNCPNQQVGNSGNLRP